MIKAVIFDIDGVLLDSFETNLKFFQDLMIKGGYNPPTREEYKKLFHYNMFDVIKILTKSNSEEEIQRIVKFRTNKEVAYPHELVTAPKEMKETIEVLAKDYFLGVVTSRTKNSVFASPIMKEIESYFKYSVSLEDTVKHKPDPEPLLLIVEKLNIKKEEAVYIGDTETDFQAAKSAGMKFILFSKEKVDGVEISTSVFSELPDLINKL
jgi:HAD superfamily hydrolase (TIGR01549 family)